MKKPIAFLLAIVVALGIGLPLALGGGNSRPTPEAFLQTLVSEHLTWTSHGSAEVAIDNARAVEFVVTPKAVEVILIVSRLVTLKDVTTVANQDLALTADVILHYSNMEAVVNAEGAFESIVGVVQFVGPPPTLYLQNVGSYVKHTVEVGVDPLENYLFVVSR